MAATTEPLIERIEIGNAPIEAGFGVLVHQIAVALNVQAELCKSGNNVVITASGQAGDLAKFAQIIVRRVCAANSHTAIEVDVFPS